MRLPSEERFTGFAAQALGLDDPRPYPPQDALERSAGLVTETAIEAVSSVVCEALIGAVHSTAQRIERDALQSLGSEILELEIQDATRKARAVVRD